MKVRTGVGKHPIEETAGTSKDLQFSIYGDLDSENLQPATLLPFVGNHRQPMPKAIAFNLLDYIELVDWTGRAILDDKRGSIPPRRTEDH